MGTNLCHFHKIQLTGAIMSVSYSTENEDLLRDFSKGQPEDQELYKEYENLIEKFETSTSN